MNSLTVEPQGAVNGGIVKHMRLGESGGEQLTLGGAFVHHSVDQVGNYTHHGERLPHDLVFTESVEGLGNGA